MKFVEPIIKGPYNNSDNFDLSIQIIFNYTQSDEREIVTNHYLCIWMYKCIWMQ